MGICDGRVAIVTGAGRGIGREHALLLARQGASVVVNDLGSAVDGSGSDVGPAQQVVDEIVAAGGKAVANTDDVSDWKGAERLINTAVETFGKLDVLVNNAGIYEAGTIEEADLAGVERQFRVNQFGTFLGMRHALAPMRAAGGGSIVNISSIAGQLGLAGSGAYVGTKWAVRGMTKTAAVEFAPDHIRVNSVHPGYIETPMLGGVDPEALKAGVEATPLKRIGKPEDIAAAVAYLAGPDASFVTGAELTVDGGWIL